MTAATKVIEITCARCLRVDLNNRSVYPSGSIEVYTPHVRESETQCCPQCCGTMKIKVVVPDDGK